jgi:gluconate 2-dehydrogenase gamma chain
MDRRTSLKALFLGSVAGSFVLSACGPQESNNMVGKGVLKGYGRTPEETLRDQQLDSAEFFTTSEMETLTVLSDIIIPKDEVSGSASEAEVPEFIAFMVKDMPSYQLPLRGGLQWLDAHCRRHYEQPFVKLASEQQLEVVEKIAYPFDIPSPEYNHGVAFFSLLRNLVATGFFTTEMGIKDIGYIGNTPHVWDGVPEEVLAQYGLAYDARTLELSLKPEQRGEIMTWD